MVVQALDADGVLQGAALTNRAQIAVQSIMMGDPFGYASVIDRHRELDLLAVRPDARGSGIGTELLEFAEDRLSTAGIDVLSGNATSDLDLVKLRLFYERHGYTVHPSDDPLPKLLGKPWTHPMAPPAAFYFHKMLNGRPVATLGTGSPAVVPPDPNKARRPKKPKKRKKRR
jgi:GNAT superfamily N-acetyltransferase